MTEDEINNALWDMGNYIPEDANNNGAGTIASSVFDNGTTTKGPDPWAGFWQGLGGAATKVLDYSLMKDAVQTKTAVTNGRTVNGQPIYSPTAVQPLRISGGISGNTLLLIGVGVAIFLATQKG